MIINNQKTTNTIKLIFRFEILLHKNTVSRNLTLK